MTREEQAKAEPPKDEPRLGSGIKADEPDSLGLSAKPGNGQIGGTADNRSFDAIPNCRAGWSKRSSATAKRAARLNLTVKVWPDGNGHISRAAGGYTDDPSLYRAILSGVLNGLRLQLPPLGC